jgi:predicted nucleic acid-binding protein
VIVIADSSPLIILAKVGCFDFLETLYPRVYISPEVYGEVVYSGAGLPGASEVAKSAWIEVKQLHNQTALSAAYHKSSLGLGELATIFLGKELRADELLLDDHSARVLAKAEGLQVRGSIGLLEAFFHRGLVRDLRSVFKQLLSHSVYIDRRLLNRRLQLFNLPPL